MSPIEKRRERVFLVLAGLFLATLAMLNILGITRFIDLSFTLGGIDIPFVLAVGVLPYPVTFLCTDLISEIYGRERASFLVWVGLLVNLWVALFLWLGGALPPEVPLDPNTGLPPVGTHGRVFFEMKMLAFGSIAASMVAYMSAQFCDVYLFHFLKRLTRGRHLWLRNNGSTLISQLIDTTAVILITHYYAGALPLSGDTPLVDQLLTFIASGYVFKITCAAIDTLPFYLGTHWLRRYLELPEQGPPQ